MVLEGVTSSETVANNLNAMHAARKSFTQAKSSEKIRRALCQKMKPSTFLLHKNGDLEFFKRNKANHLIGPGIVIRIDSKQVLMKHGKSCLLADV